MRLMQGAMIALTVLVASPALATAPDLEGVWAIVGEPDVLVPVDGQDIIFTDEGRALYEENLALEVAGDRSFDATMTRCSSPGMPRMMLTSRPFRIFQRPMLVSFVFEWNLLARQIDLNDPPLPMDPRRAAFFIPTMKGDSVGQWDGDSLIVTTTGLSAYKLMDRYLPNSEELELIERLTLVDENTLTNRITVTDPVMFSRPWSAVITYRRLPDSTYPFAEDVCLDRREAGLGTWPN